MLGWKFVKTLLDHNVAIKSDGVDKYDSLLKNITEFQKR